MGFLSDEPPALGKMEYDPSMLHVTLLNYAIVDECKLDCLVEAFRKTAATFEPTIIEIDSQVNHYGADADIPVRCIIGEAVEKLRYMNHELTSLIHEVNGTVFSSFDFSPHVSHLSDDISHSNVNHLSLVHHANGFGEDVRNLANVHF